MIDSFNLQTSTHYSFYYLYRMVFKINNFYFYLITIYTVESIRKYLFSVFAATISSTATWTSVSMTSRFHSNTTHVYLIKILVKQMILLSYKMYCLFACAIQDESVYLTVLLLVYLLVWREHLCVYVFTPDKNIRN